VVSNGSPHGPVEEFGHRSDDHDIWRTGPIWMASDRRLARYVGRPIAGFLKVEAAGGIVLLFAAVVALVWANSPWSSSYESLWSTEVRHWVNDGLMAVFFFVVGLEIKRELVVGELRSPRAAALPVIAAVGGMAVPALLYLAVNAGDPGADGWGIPMATDIAFAVGVVALLGSRVPAPLKLFLLALAIVDDIGAIVLIAVFYSDGIDGVAFAVAGAAALAVVALWRLRAPWITLVAAAVVLWGATYESGVHATIAGVVLGLLTPARPSGASPAERLEHRLHPVASFGIVPLFALANAGVRIEAGVLDAPGAGAVALGVALGLVVGKPVGVAGATWLALRTGLGRLPGGVTLPQVLGVGAVAGIGFTVSLFITGLAFPPGRADLDAAAKIGVLAASVLAAMAGSVLLGTSGRRRQPRRQRR
jgi:NhaA family Na+:H+ antiporter